MPRGTHPNSLANLKRGKATQFGADGGATAKEAGKKSAEARAERKSLKDALLLLLSAQINDEQGNPTSSTVQDAVISGVVKRAMDGDVKAATFIRDTIGEKPVDRVASVTPDAALLDEVEKALFGQ